MQCFSITQDINKNQIEFNNNVILKQQYIINLYMGKIIENYSLQIQLGSGVYSKVYKGINIKTKQQVAVKMIKTQKIRQIPQLQAGIINEINTLSNIDACENIVKYYDMLKTPNNFYFIYEFCNEGTLEKLISKSRRFSQKQALIYLKQIFQAFKILNKYNIMHRDIKPDNILLHNGKIKLADFGFCKPLEYEQQLTHTMLGSPVYMAPQTLRGQPYSRKADIWSVGVVLFKMLYGYCPFQSHNIAQLITLLKQSDLKIPNEPRISPTLQQLLKRMLTKDYSQRIDWPQIFQYQISDGIIVSKLKPKLTLKSSTAGSSKSSYVQPGQDLPQLNCKSTNSYGQYEKIQENFQNELKQKQLVSSEGMKNADNTFHKMKNSQNSYEKSHLSKQIENNYKSHNNFGQKYSKINIFLKNHRKCIELSSIAIQVSMYKTTQAIILSYQLNKIVNNQLKIIYEGVKKQYKNQNYAINFNQQLTMSFIVNLEEEIKFIEECLQMYNDEINSNILQQLNNNKQPINKSNLKTFIVSIDNEKMSELSLILQLLDYIEQGILIKKTTYDKLTMQQMNRQINTKIKKLDKY